MNSFGQGFQLGAKNLVEQALWPRQTTAESLVPILSRSGSDSGFITSNTFDIFFMFTALNMNMCMSQ